MCMTRIFVSYFFLYGCHNQSCSIFVTKRVFICAINNVCDRIEWIKMLMLYPIQLTHVLLVCTRGTLGISLPNCT